MTRDELELLTADEEQRRALPVMGSLADQSMSPHEIAAQRLRAPYRNLPQPGTNPLESFASKLANIPGNILSARAKVSQNYPEMAQHMIEEPFRKARGFVEAGTQASAEQFPLQTMAPGSVLNVSTDVDPRRRAADLGAETALNITGLPALGVKPAGAAGMGAARDPNLWHGISTVKLPKPVAEMQATHLPTVQSVEKAITPADLQGGLLLPGLGDRSRTGSNLLSFNGYPLTTPVPMQGGHGFMAEQADKGIAWASGKPVANRIVSAAEELSAKGKPVYFPYTAMGERAVDFSHHVALPLAQAVKTEKIPKSALKDFDAAMQTKDADFKAVKDWPGVKADNLEEFLLSSKGEVRNKFAKLMDTREFQNAGFPSVAEARFAVTDPKLLHAPTGAAGRSVAKLDPGASLKGTSGHLTYNTDVPGAYLGGLGRSIPKEVFYPDLIDAYKKLGYPEFRHDYLMARGVEGAPIAQRATQKWVDRVSNWMEKNPREAMKYALPPAALGGLAAQDQYQQRGM